MECRSKISAIAICLLAVSLTAGPIKADESLLPDPIPPSEISISEISETFVVDENAPEVDPEFVEAKVREYFADIPVMIKIAKCESGFKQYQEDGSLTVSKAVSKKTRKRVSSASGAFQILYIGHFESWSSSDDTNITTLEGNLRFARMMYEESGTSPWAESKKCWKRKLPA
jgi:hypothetical protein